MVTNDLFWQFLKDNANEDPNKLRLKYSSSKDLGFDVNFAINQIDCRRRAKNKLPSLVEKKSFLFPTVLSSEQSTSELLAGFHSSFVESEDTVLDMTCGLGVDAMTIANKCKSVDAVEINPEIYDCVSYNVGMLSIDNLCVVNASSIDYLISSVKKWDLIFVDPARRSVENKRVFSFEDCQPNILEHIDLIRAHCNFLLIKVSPMLDITSVVKVLPSVTDIYAVSIKNECKEILVKCDFRNDNNCKVNYHALNFTASSDCSEFEYSNDLNSKDNLPYVQSLDEIGQKWLYEPNSSVMKLACWGELFKKYPLLRKLHPNTHIFISDANYVDFPGRRLRINSIYSPKSKELRNLKGEYFNVVTRNYPYSAEIVKKQLKINDGGKRFIYCVKVANEKNVILLAE